VVGQDVQLLHLVPGHVGAAGDAVPYRGVRTGLKEMLSGRFGILLKAPEEKVRGAHYLLDLCPLGTQHAQS